MGQCLGQTSSAVRWPGIPGTSICTASHNVIRWSALFQSPWWDSLWPSAPLAVWLITFILLVINSLHFKLVIDWLNRLHIKWMKAVIWKALNTSYRCVLWHATYLVQSSFNSPLVLYKIRRHCPCNWLLYFELVAATGLKGGWPYTWYTFRKGPHMHVGDCIWPRPCSYYFFN